MNAAFFEFFYILYKRTQKNAAPSFWFNKSYKNDKSCNNKKRKRMQLSFYKVKKEFNVLFSIYINISIYIYIYLPVYIYIYIYIYIEKKNEGWA